MNISKLNPIGYEAKTENGNTYKKSNIGASSMLLAAGAIDAIPHFSKNKKLNSICDFLSMESLFRNDAKIFNIKISPKAAPFLRATAIGFDLLCGLWLGGLIDKAINAKRMEKADKAAEQTIDKNV